MLRKKKMNKRYKIIHEIGKGNYGIVYKAYDYKKKCIIALKKINISTESLKEKCFLENLSNKYIIEYFDSFIFNNFLYI